jgi:hypothetical protein
MADYDITPTETTTSVTVNATNYTRVVLINDNKFSILRDGLTAVWQEIVGMADADVSKAQFTVRKLTDGTGRPEFTITWTVRSRA